MGMAEELIASGYRIDKVGFYEGQTRCLGVDLAKLSTDYPFLLVAQQRTLEDLLEARLKRTCGVSVLWNHRLADLRVENDFADAVVEKLGGTVTGYSVPTWEVVVQKRLNLQAAFVVGADGHHSLTRQLLGIGYERVGSPELYSVFEFATDAEFDHESRIVLDPAMTSVLWPLTAFA
jgi:2-polyprenyl-6-methoxyphenol hydroxylase-like FAD-dependent oxidoreductase